jgi:hypothetical protein
VLSIELGVALRDVGLVWKPQNGDRFFVPDRDLDDTVFVLSDMVIQELKLPDGTPLLAFNGTTEWALDSLEASEAIWLPREGQLRELLGDAFERLEPLPAPGGGYAVQASGERYVDVTADNAYARALLDVLSR